MEQIRRSALLGCAILDRRLYELVRRWFVPDDFTDWRDREIFILLETRYRAGDHGSDHRA